MYKILGLYAYTTHSVGIGVECGAGLAE